MAYRAVPEGLDLDGVLCFQYRRTVAADNTVSFGRQVLQLLPGPARASYTKAQVVVQERLDGRIVVCHQGTTVATAPAPEGPVDPQAQGQGSGRRGLPGRG